MTKTDDFGLDLYGFFHCFAEGLGGVEGVLAGHALNNALVRALLATPHAWRLRTLAPELAEAV